MNAQFAENTVVGIKYCIKISLYYLQIPLNVIRTFDANKKEHLNSQLKICSYLL